MENNKQILRVCFNLKLSRSLSLLQYKIIPLFLGYVWLAIFFWCVGVNWISLYLGLIFHSRSMLCLPSQVCTHILQLHGLVTYHKVWAKQFVRSLFFCRRHPPIEYFVLSILRACLMFDNFWRLKSMEKQHRTTINFSFCSQVSTSS